MSHDTHIHQMNFYSNKNNKRNENEKEASRLSCLNNYITNFFVERLKYSHETDLMVNLKFVANVLFWLLLHSRFILNVSNLNPYYVIQMYHFVCAHRLIHFNMNIDGNVMVLRSLYLYALQIKKRERCLYLDVLYPLNNTFIGNSSEIICKSAAFFANSYKKKEEARDKILLTFALLRRIHEDSWKKLGKNWNKFWDSNK